MSSSAEFLNPSEAAKLLGVSAKALRLYEKRGLITPLRTASGWRVYGPQEMDRAAEIASLRALGLSLAQVGQVLTGNPQCLSPALAAHQTVLESQVRQITDKIEKVRLMRANLDRGRAPAFEELARLMRPAACAAVAFDLPWPWGGERFELHVRPLNFIVGPLFSGKTRLAHAIADSLPDCAFIGLERLANEGADAQDQMQANPALRARIDQVLTWLVEDGASVTAALVALVAALELAHPKALVIDMVEQGLGHATQEALIAHLRRRAPEIGPLFLLTRSCSILDLAAVGPNETVILCPANHSPPSLVAPDPGSPGYEAIATCLASPEVRARTEGVIAIRANAA